MKMDTSLYWATDWDGFAVIVRSGVPETYL